MKLIIGFVLTLFMASQALANKPLVGLRAGVILVKSKHSVEKTIDNLEAILKEKGITVVTRWKHQNGAKKAGLKLRPTELIIFGNPMVGSHFFTSQQSAGLDLPQRALAFEDEKKQTWLIYNDPKFIAQRHGIKNRKKIIKKMTRGLKKMTTKACN